jgi:hypothetical protein
MPTAELKEEEPSSIPVEGGQSFNSKEELTLVGSFTKLDLGHSILPDGNSPPLKGHKTVEGGTMLTPPPHLPPSLAVLPALSKLYGGDLKAKGKVYFNVSGWDQF